MLRISTLTKALNLFGAGKHGFQNGDMATSTPPTDFDAEWCNGVQEELLSVIEAAGLVPSDASYAQLLEAIKRMIDIQAGNYALDTGAANAYVIALDPVIAAYTDGMTVRFRAVNANTGASTLNAGGGAVALVNDVAGALVANDVPAGGIVSATYDAGLNKFLITSLVPSQALSQTAANALYAKINTGKAVGDVFISLSSTPPDGALTVPTTATSISRAAYPDLHQFCSVRGYPWGAGDGATTFGMPYIAAGHALVQGAGNVRTTTAGQMPAHTHGVQLAGGGGGSNVLWNAGSPAGTFQQSASAGSGSDNLAAGVRVLFCVQYQQ